MVSYLLPITLIQARICPACNEKDILDWKSHLYNKHLDLVVYHQQNQIIEYLRKTKYD